MLHKFPSQRRQQPLAGTVLLKTLLSWPSESGRAVVRYVLRTLDLRASELRTAV